MKISIRNLSNKRRSKQAMNELKEFAREQAELLGIDSKIKEIRLRYTTDFHGYFPKGKPLYGFKKLFSKGIVRIDLTRHWDISQSVRKSSIHHELIHVKQIINKDLQINRTGTIIKWKGKVINSWKKFRFDKQEEKRGKAFFNYTVKLLPWERDVLTSNWK